MKRHGNIVIPMPDLSPEAACAFADWIATVAHKVGMYYGDLIRSDMEMREREAAEIEEEIGRLREADDEPQDEIPF